MIVLFNFRCPPGFNGHQCEGKVPSDASMYPQPATYTCNLGLSTKLFCQET